MREFISIYLIIMLLTVSGCSEIEMIQEDFSPEITAYVVYEDNNETSEPEEISVEEPVPPALPEQIDFPRLNTVFAVKCINDRIGLMLANPTDHELTLAKDIIIHLNGMIVVDPECEKNTLLPGESIYCFDISGHLPIRQGKENALKIEVGPENNFFIVDCSS